MAGAVRPARTDWAPTARIHQKRAAARWYVRNRFVSPGKSATRRQRSAENGGGLPKYPAPHGMPGHIRHPLPPLCVLKDPTSCEGFRCTEANWRCCEDLEGARKQIDAAAMLPRCCWKQIDAAATPQGDFRPRVRRNRSSSARCGPIAIAYAFVCFRAPPKTLQLRQSASAPRPHQPRRAARPDISGPHHHLTASQTTPQPNKTARRAQSPSMKVMMCG